MHLVRIYDSTIGRLAYRVLVNEARKAGVLKELRRILGRGKGSKIKRNGSGDMIFINKNKGIVIRADIKKPYPDTRPYVHIELRKPNGKHVPYKNLPHRIYLK